MGNRQIRVALGVQYNGNHYHGWQHQPGLKTPQLMLQKALSFIANHPVEVICAGRTDTAVHATGQVVHFDTTVNRPERAWTVGTNARLPHDIAVQWAQEVPEDFSARYSATYRCYRYFIYNSSTPPAVLRREMSWHYAPLDADLMHDGAQLLLGDHDFNAFRSSVCQAPSSRRCLQEITVKRQGKVIQIDVKANAFLHHMVRNIVGVLLSVGEKKQSVEWVADVLKSGDRTQGGVTAPPYGLYLVEVGYPQEFGLPSGSFPVLSL